MRQVWETKLNAKLIHRSLKTHQRLKFNHKKRSKHPNFQQQNGRGSEQTISFF
jgi:hypothetical protein